MIWERDACWRSIPKRRRRQESSWENDRAHEAGWAEQSGRWGGLSGRGQRLRLDRSVCGWLRILRAGCIYTLRCYVAFDDYQRNVVMELLLHSYCDNRKDSFDLSDTRGRDCGSLRCFFGKIAGRIHGSLAGGDHHGVRRSIGKTCAVMQISWRGPAFL